MMKVVEHDFRKMSVRRRSFLFYFEFFDLIIDYLGHVEADDARPAAPVIGCIGASGARRA